MAEPMNVLPPAPEPVPTAAATTTSYAVWFLGAAAILGGLACAADRLATGDFKLLDYGDCFTKVVAGFGILSPGLGRFKAGFFARE